MKLDRDFFKNVLDLSYDEIFVCDGTGTTLYCNERFEKNYGITRDEMLGQKTTYLVENGYSTHTPIPEVIATKKTVTRPQRTATGKLLIVTARPHFDEHGNIDYIVENCRDITELEAVKEELNEKELELARIKYKIKKDLDENSQGFQSFTSPSMVEVATIVKKVAPTDVTVLIQGESGTGKTFIANSIHRNSARKDQPFISINCSTIPETLFESEFFGYTSGAFTGATTKGKTGLIELANGGTLFLDEIGEIPLQLQGKLLQVIQEKKFTPVGSTKETHIDIRIIAATNQPLEQRIRENKFREDLFYRLNVVSLTMPALRQRQEDIESLATFFLKKYATQYKKEHYFSSQVMDILIKYHWPGNIRELENLIQHIVVMSSNEEISRLDLPTKLIIESDEQLIPSVSMDFEHLMETYERSLLEESMRHYKSSYKIAQHMNISQTKASRLLRKHRLTSK
ncbi:MAG: sigma 54-interacting transcriptional regulator [Clostridia bacterium]|nr:sigma 54-interacting transcriptional regulator [Clostridia bacterium]